MCQYIQTTSYPNELLPLNINPGPQAELNTSLTGSLGSADCIASLNRLPLTPIAPPYLKYVSIGAQVSQMSQYDRAGPDKYARMDPGDLWTTP